MPSKLRKVFSQICILVMVFFNYDSLFGQDLHPTKTTVKYKKSTQSCWEVHVDPEPKTLKKAWKEFLKQNYDFRLKGIGFLANKDLLTAEEVDLPVLNANSVNFFTHIVEDDAGSAMKVFASDQQRFFSDTYSPESFRQLRRMLENFMKVYLVKYHRGKLNDTRKRVEELTDETMELEEDIADNMEEIEELTEEIEEMKELNETKKSRLEENRRKLELRKSRLENKRQQLQDL